MIIHKDVLCELYWVIVLGILHGRSHNLNEVGDCISIVLSLDEIYATELRRAHVYIHRIFHKDLLFKVVVIPSAYIVHRLIHSKLEQVIVVPPHV